MELQSIKLKNFDLIKVNLDNKEHLIFLKELFQNKDDKSLEFLGDLSNVSDKNAFVVRDVDLKFIGYFSMSIPTVNKLGLRTSGIYYAIDSRYRNKGYATKLLQEVSSYLFGELDMLVLSIDKDNKASRRVAEKNFFHVIFEDEDDV